LRIIADIFLGQSENKTASKRKKRSF